MTRCLLLVFFLTMCCATFMAGNLFAAESDTSTQQVKTPQDSLANMLKMVNKKSSTDTKLSSVKEQSKLKPARHKTSKKFASRKKTTKKSAYSAKHHKKQQQAYGKNKLRKTSKHKPRTAKKSL